MQAERGRCLHRRRPQSVVGQHSTATKGRRGIKCRAVGIGLCLRLQFSAISNMQPRTGPPSRKAERSTERRRHAAKPCTWQSAPEGGFPIEQSSVHRNPPPSPFPACADQLKTEWRRCTTTIGISQLIQEWCRKLWNSTDCFARRYYRPPVDLQYGSCFPTLPAE